MSEIKAIQLENVTKRYLGQARPALSDLSMTVNAGEFVSLLGPSGSGKSTALSLIAGFQELTSGTVRIGGEDVGAIAPHKRDLGVVFQDYALFPHMSVEKNVEFPLKQRNVKVPERRKRVKSALEAVHLEHLAHRRPEELSGGQRQRVALARSFVFDPPALLMDEPLSALDKNLRGQMQEEIGRLHAELQKTVLFVTHDQEEALALSDRICVFNEGQLLQIGTPSELFSQPKTLFIAQFLGESSVVEGNYSSKGVASFFGDKLPVKTLADISIGEKVSVMIRPHQVRITETGQGIRSTISRLRYTGAETVVTAETAVGEIKFLVQPSNAPKIGEVVSLNWDEGTAIAYGQEQQ